MKTPTEEIKFIELDAKISIMLLLLILPVNIFTIWAWTQTLHWIGLPIIIIGNTPVYFYIRNISMAGKKRRDIIMDNL